MLEFDIPLEPLAWIEHMVDESLRDQCSFVAIDMNTSHSDLVGVILNGKVERDQVDDPFIIQSEKLRFIYSLIDNVSAGHDLFERYRTDRLLHCGYGKRVLSRRSSIVIVHHRSRHRTASIVDHSLLIEINARSPNGVFDATFSCLCSTTSTMHP